MQVPPTKGNAACSVMFDWLITVEWVKVAQSVGKPERANCGTCHFNGGGGDGVKHGDLDSSLLNASRDLDVHMDSKGLNFPCTQCHLSKQHIISGSRYDVHAKDPEGVGQAGVAPMSRPANRATETRRIP